MRKPVQLYNVRLNGEDIASGLTLDRAKSQAGQLRGRGLLQIYLSDKPIEGRKPSWKRASWPAMPKLHVNSAYYRKLAASGALQVKPEPDSWSESVLQAGAL